MSFTEAKMVCEECEWRGLAAERLTSTNPLDEEDVLFHCPKCKTPDKCFMACDEPDCWKPVACGTPTASGYRQTCSRHKPAAEAAGGES